MTRLIVLTIFWLCLAASGAWAAPQLPAGVDPSEFCGLSAAAGPKKVGCHHTLETVCRCAEMRCGQLSLSGECRCGMQSDDTTTAPEMKSQVEFSLLQGAVWLPNVEAREVGYLHVFPRPQSRGDDVPTPPPPQF